MLTFLHKLLILSLWIVGFFDWLFGLGVGRVKIVVQPEELNDAGDINNGNEHPSEHPFVE